MSETGQDPNSENSNLLIKSLKTIKRLPYTALLLIVVGTSILSFIFLLKEVFQFSKLPISSQPGVQLLEWTHGSSSNSELEKPLACVDTLKNAVNSGKFKEGLKDVANLLFDRLTVRNYDLYYHNRRPENIIRSAEDLAERLNKYRECAIDVALPKVGICSIHRGTGPYVQEWLSYYLMHGVSKVFMYDNSVPNSRDNVQLLYATRPFVDAGYVEVRTWTRTFHQSEAYNDCLERGKSTMDWLAFFDFDEYLIVKEPGPTCLPQFLDGYKQFPGLVFRWRVFTPRGVIQHNFSRLFFEQYRWSHPGPKEGKSILNTKFKIEITNPHILYFQDGNKSVCSNKRVCHTHDYSKEPYKYAELRHYWGVDWDFTFFVKLCNRSPRRVQMILYRLNVALRFLDQNCCLKIEGRTRQEVSLRNFLFGES